MNTFWIYPIPLSCLIIGALLLVSGFIPKLVNRVFAARSSWIGIGALFVAGTVLLPSENHLLGDGYTHLSNVERWFSPTEPLDILLHHLVYLLTGDMLLAYRIVATVAGGFFMWGVYLVSRLGESPTEQAIIGLSFLSIATVQFYFGYVESYTLRNLFIFFFIYSGWIKMRRRRRSLLPVLFFLLAIASHFSAAVMLPALVYLYWKRFGSWVLIPTAAVVVIGTVVAYQVGPGKILVPILPTEFSSYSVAATQHVIDILNLLILVAPTFLLGALTSRADTVTRFALVALGGALVFTLLVDAKIGAFRDWDLLAVFALPMAAVIAIRAPRKNWVVGVICALICVRIVPWILFNSESQAQKIREITLADPHYTAAYDNGWRLVSFGRLLHEAGDDEGALIAFHRRIEIVPGCERTLDMLGTLHFIHGNYRAAYEFLSRLVPLQPGNMEKIYYCSYSAFLIEETDAGLLLLSKLSPEEIIAHNMAAVAAGLLIQKGQTERAMQFLDYGRWDVSEDYLPYSLARTALHLGRTDLAGPFIDMAIQVKPEKEEYVRLRRQIDSARSIH